MNHNSSTLKILRSSSLPGAIQQEILQMILDGTFKPGDQLREAELALRLGVSRGPVREAFRGLEEAKLLCCEKNKGVYVRSISMPEIIELYTVRQALDELIGRQLAPRISEEELAELHRCADEMDASVARGDIHGYFLLNMNFHDRIAEMAGNQKLLEIYRRLMNETLLIRHKGLAQGGGFLVSNTEHRQIIEALATRNPDTAAKAMGEHVGSGYRRLATLLQVESPVL